MFSSIANSLFYYISLCTWSGIRKLYIYNAENSRLVTLAESSCILWDILLWLRRVDWSFVALVFSIFWWHRSCCSCSLFNPSSIFHSKTIWLKINIRACVCSMCSVTLIRFQKQHIITLLLPKLPLHIYVYQYTEGTKYKKNRVSLQACYDTRCIMTFCDVGVTFYCYLMKHVR